MTLNNINVKSQFTSEAILMSTHNMGFCEDLTKIIFRLVLHWFVNLNYGSIR